MLLKVIFGERISIKSGSLILESLGSVTDAEHAEDPNLITWRLKTIQAEAGPEYERMGIVDIEIDGETVFEALTFLDGQPPTIKGKAEGSPK